MAQLTAQQKLDQARQALHQLLTGQKSVEVRFGERGVRYSDSSADISKLRQYISELEIEVGLKPARKPFGVIW